MRNFRENPFNGETSCSMRMERRTDMGMDLKRFILCGALKREPECQFFFRCWAKFFTTALRVFSASFCMVKQYWISFPDHFKDF